MNIKSKLKSTFYKAYNQISNSSEYKNTPDITRRSFAGCVAIFCHDDIDNPINQRMAYLSFLIKYTKGPTIREHYCNWKAMSLGDAIPSDDITLTSFLVDPRLPKVGTWAYDKAYNFCLEHIFSPINEEHYRISLQEPHFDDPKEDLDALAKFGNSSTE